MSHTEFSGDISLCISDNENIRFHFVIRQFIRLECFADEGGFIVVTFNLATRYIMIRVLYDYTGQ